MSIDQFATLMALTPEKRLLLLELIQEEKRNHADHLAAEVERLRAVVERVNGILGPVLRKPTSGGAHIHLSDDIARELAELMK